MIIWMAMLIPIISCLIAYKLWPMKYVWWEFLLPTAASFLFILITKFGVESALLHDTQYKGGLIVEARYYEYWETWVSKKCSYDCNCKKDKNGHEQCETCWRDCSYCDENSAYWQAKDDQGNTYSISEAEYNRLKKQWNATPQFVELNRSIDYSHGCGKDGNMYLIKWSGEVLTSEASTWTSSYENKTQAAKSNFDLREVSDKEAKKYGLFAYPKLDNYKQRVILGLDSMSFLTAEGKTKAHKIFEYFNGNYGPKRKMRVFILLFNNQPFDVAIKQKNYWEGGNKNEVVICIDVNKATGEINWVYPFTWTDNKRIAVDLREDISNINFLDFNILYKVVENATPEFQYKDFSKFDYIEIDPPTWEVWLIYILTIIITVLVLYYGYMNEFESDKDGNIKRTNNYSKRF